MPKIPSRAEADDKLGSDGANGAPALRSSSTSNSKVPAFAAAAFGILGIIFAVIVPLLPVTQTTSHVSWPQDRDVNSVTLPLVAYYPQNIDVAVPCTEVSAVAESGGGNVLVSTAPAQAPDAGARALTVSVAGEQVEVRSRGSLIATAPVSALKNGGCSEIKVHSDANLTAAEFTGAMDEDGNTYSGATGDDVRPQVVGIYSDISGAAPEGLSVDIEIDSRYTTDPTLIKKIAIGLGVLMVIASLIALHRLDRRDGRTSRRFAPRNWWKPRPLDLLVMATLVLWHIIGANTSDDGYIITEARLAPHSSYMPEVFRYFGAPYAPFGMPYYLYSFISHFTLASVWLRLPTLILAFATWFLISREVIPRLGVAARHHAAVRWTAAAIFLAFWLTYNNGIRPEPIVAFGVIATWVSLERALATNRLLPAAVAFIVGGLTLSAAPTGTFCIAAIIAAARPLLVLIVRRAKRDGWAATIAPLLASGLGILFLIFLDQPLKSTLQSSALLGRVGPKGEWYEEYWRYQWLLDPTPDGSLARRFAMIALIIALVTCAMILFRKGRIPGVALGPSRRILGLSVLSIAFMAFNPTKWTHHFGAFASIGALLGALVTLAVLPAATRSLRNRVLFLAGIFFLLALSFTAPNGWWYISIYGIPFGGVAPSVKGIHLYEVFFVLMFVAMFAALLLHFREAFVPPKEKPEQGPESRFKTLLKETANAPLGLAAGFVVLVMVASMLYAAKVQAPAYSVAQQNINGLKGNECALGDAVLAEPDPNKGMLKPASLDVAHGLDAKSEGDVFTANGIPRDLSSSVNVDANTGGPSTGENSDDSAATAGTGGGTTAVEGINGSRTALPFGLDPETTPVLSSYQQGDVQISGMIESDWYTLPSAQERGPLLTMAVAGRFREGEVKIEYTTGDPTQGDKTEAVDSVDPIDVGPAPSWRNLRVPLDEIPDDATAVRVVVKDDDSDPDRWIAVTPPRIPVTQTMQDLIGDSAPVLPDWAVAFHVPCVRPFEEFAGVTELPEYRILPDRGLAASSTNTWEGWDGGGPLGFIELTLEGETVPTYLDHDWDRDWGSLVRYKPFVPDAKPAEVQHEEVTRSGLYDAGPVSA
ncbi:arabinosyltransferase domain-containing protein [Dietzia sp.]|uniref:arabinosyltransferase domain-containing protein n=1 Tax=Dietzia sp. TaxID=1871616 RepID=UPI002FDA579E